MSDKREPIEFDGEMFHPVPSDDVAYASEGGRIAFHDFRSRGGGRFRLACTRIVAGALRAWYSANGRRRDRTVARLVWETFRGEIPSDSYIGTVSADVCDVRLENLTVRHRRESGGGLRSGRSVLSRRQVMEIRSRPEAMIADLANEHGVSEATISYVRSGTSYRDVASPVPLPATAEQRDRLGRRMREVGISDRFVEFVLSRVERSGRLRIPAKEAEAFGIAVWPRTVAITIARRHHLLRQAGRQIYEAAVDMPEGTWQSHFEDLVLSQHQREVLSVRVGRALAINDEIPSCVVDSIVDATSLDGRFDKGAITRTAFSSAQSRVIMRLLLCGGVVAEVSRRTLVFVDMPGRTHTHGREGARVKPVEPSSSGYREAVRMLARGDDLSAVAYESGVPAAVAQKMAKALSMDIVARQLIASGKQSQLHRLLGIPKPAADAIAEHVSRSNHTGLQTSD